MHQSLLAIGLALSVIVLTVSLATASIEPPRELAPTDRSSQPDQPDLARPDVPCLVRADGAKRTDWQMETPIPTGRA